MRLASLRPSYVIRRLAQKRFVRRMPDAPWLTESAVLLLSEWLKPTDTGLEWGSGRSTIWIGRRVARVLSVEHDEAWYREITMRLDSHGIAERIDYRFVDCPHTDTDEPDDHPYAAVADEVADASLDFALVDGRIRLTCLRRALPKLKPGGLLILDNANRYVPNRFGDGFATVHIPREKPLSDNWRRTLESLRDWRWLNCSDGIWDTRMWIKPLA